MFDALRATLARKKAARSAAATAAQQQRAALAQQHVYQQAMATWQTEHDQAQHLVEYATAIHPGSTAGDVMLKSGEAVVGYVTGASLVQDRTTPGHYVGGSAGVSVPIGSIAGRSVRYRVGAQRGHFVPGVPTPTAVDVGTFYITDQRFVYSGQKQSHEMLLSKVVAMHRDDDLGKLTVGVSNRQKNVIVYYGPKVGESVKFYLDLAVARHAGEADAFVAQLQASVDEIDAKKPTPPATGA